MYCKQVIKPNKTTSLSQSLTDNVFGDLIGNWFCWWRHSLTFLQYSSFIFVLRDKKHVNFNDKLQLMDLLNISRWEMKKAIGIKMACHEHVGTCPFILIIEPFVCAKERRFWKKKKDW